MEDTKTIASDELLAKELNERDWAKFWPRLIGRCAWLLRKKYTVKWSNDDLLDFSHKAISDVFDKIFIEKVRKWNTDRYPDFEDFIVGALDSHVNNLLNKQEAEFADDDVVRKLSSGWDVQNQSDVIVTEELRKEIFDELKKSGADDDELLVFECLADGINKPENIRAELGLTEDDFRRIWRRLKSKREVIRKKLAANGY